MPENTQAPRVCRDCDGFATATITTGLRATDGTRDTVRVHCRTCRGLGHNTPAALVRAGR
ncbi:hypothetical protein [Streptomyces sp. NPDC127114]|uniref:hypothetical protein n=1 Tax=Streptomyces sp. NPDC127114 TaxID=3345366 RepID=UPI00363753A5